jgi:hypothetical protein
VAGGKVVILVFASGVTIFAVTKLEYRSIPAAGKKIEPAINWRST